MPERRQCSDCGVELPADAPGGHCVRCILQFGLTIHDDPALLDEDALESEALTAGRTEQTGDRIGRYKLLQQIGEGGCGVVYLAEQEQPVRRRVALKVIKLGMDTKTVIARFEAERQALPLMDHPNIAKVFDGGATNTGRPFFVMELVEGRRITDYCDENQLSTRQRLELFTQVCHAIQHAHQKGIIHRDIKPSNILVLRPDPGSSGVPKVIDFGIAKATDQQLTDKTLLTAFEQFIGTPAYMSPEQTELSSADIDTRSDIYSLGVLLYELLAGKAPFQSAIAPGIGLDQLRRMIREKEPPRPSTCLGTLSEADLAGVAKHRRIEPLKLIQLVRGDLDRIVMKTLEKDRARRYETANGLAQDIQRFLNDEPVLARLPSNIYRLRKLVRRNKLAFASAAAVAAALLLGLGFSLWSLMQEKKARQRAITAEAIQSELRQAAVETSQDESRLRQQAQIDEKKAETEAARSQQVAQFLKDMLKGLGPLVALGRDTTLLREILDRTAARVCQDLTNQPEVELDLCLALAGTYDEMALDEQEEEMAREALLLARSIFGEGHPAVAAAMRRLGYALSNRGRFEEAEPLICEALAIQTNLVSHESVEVAESLSTLANIYWGQGKLAAAENTHREALDIRRRLAGDNDPAVGGSLNDLAGVLTLEGKLPEAETMYREAVAMARELLGPENASLAISINNLASVLKREGKPVEAEAMFRQALALEHKLLGNEHPTLAVSLNNLALLLQTQGKIDEAESLQRQALTMEQKLLGTEHQQTAVSLRNLASILRDQGKLEEAEGALRSALAIQRKLLGANNPDTAATLESLADLLGERGKWAEAEAAKRELLAIRDKNAKP